MYSAIDIKTPDKLYLIRKGLFSREIELTDNTYNYGKIVYHRLSKRIATTITATGTWIFKRADNSYRHVSITDENGLPIGTANRDIFSRAIILTLQTGFVAKFYKSSFWSGNYIWESENNGQIMHIDSYPYSLTTAVNIDQSMEPASLIPLLTFFGSYLIVLKKRQNTAIARSILYIWWGSGNVKR